MNGVSRLHAQDATQNLGLFLTAAEPPTGLEVVDYKDVVGIEGDSLGLGIRTTIPRIKGDALPLLAWGDLTSTSYRKHKKIIYDLSFLQPQVFMRSLNLTRKWCASLLTTVQRAT